MTKCTIAFITAFIEVVVQIALVTQRREKN